MCNHFATAPFACKFSISKYFRYILYKYIMGKAYHIKANNYNNHG